MHLTIPSTVFSIPKVFNACLDFFKKRSLDKKIRPYRDAACASPARVAWSAKPGTEEYRLFERMVNAKLIIRSPWFPNQYMLPSRWH